MERAWIGIDAGKSAHHATAVDDGGQVIWSQRVANDQAAIEELIGKGLRTAENVTWAIDLAGSPAALAIALLLSAGQRLVYVPGRTVHRMSGAFRGEGKTDAKDAWVIAETARLRRDLTALSIKPELIAELAVLTAHRADLTTDWTRTITRLRDYLTGMFPALEKAFNFAKRGPLILLELFQTPQAIRDAGREEITAQLKARQARKATILANKALAAAQAQTVTLPGQNATARLIQQMASYLLALHRRIQELDNEIAELFEQHPQAPIILSMPGMGPVLGAEFLAAIGDTGNFRDADHLAAFAGLAPVPRESGRRVGVMRRPKHYSRTLRRVFYMSALTSLKFAGPNREYFDRKRAEGHKPRQALIALARRRVDVLWALLRDHRCFQPVAPTPAT
ncbi:IS110 family transposase [Micromonospora sp. NPDC049051]|uniref:IS110 family transposase n=1 Tax=Micromonospora sp. NPDC049051 TaxID=3364264 RepID=UPI0037135658